MWEHRFFGTSKCVRQLAPYNVNLLLKFLFKIHSFVDFPVDSFRILTTGSIGGSLRRSLRRTKSILASLFT